MPFLSLNGWEVEVADNAAALEFVEVGASEGRGFAGTNRSTRRALKRKGEFTATPLSNADGSGLIRLLNGEGWHFPFDSDLYSEDTLLNPTTGYTATLGTATPSPKFGTKRLTVPSATTIAWDCALSTSYTLACWFWNGAAWEHWVRRSDAGVVTLWKDGTSGQAACGFMKVSSTSAQLLGRNAADDGNAAAYIDDLVVLPWSASDGQIAAWCAATAAFSALPKLDLAGDVLREGGTIEVRGKVSAGKFLQARLSGTWSTTNRVVTFSVEEV